MSTITVTNIKATGETASRAVSGVAAAWVNFNGTGTIAARDSQNVSSLTDNGTGDYTITVANTFDNTGYSTVLCGSPVFGVATSFSMQIANSNSGTEIAPTPAAIRVTYGSTTSYHDVKYATCTIHGDLA